MKRSTKVVAFCAIGLSTLLLTTQPGNMPSLLLILPFILLFIVLWLSLAKVLARVGFSEARSLRAGMLGAGSAVLLLILQSLGQLTVRDTLTTLALFVIGYFYLSRVTLRRPT